MEFELLSIAAHMALLRQHLAQGSQAALGAVFLVEADDGVDHHHGQDDSGVADIADQRRQTGSTDQNQCQHALELAQEKTPSRSWGRPRESIGAAGLQTTGRFGGAQTRCLIHGQPPCHVSDLGAVPEHPVGGTRVAVRPQG